MRRRFRRRSHPLVQAVHILQNKLSGALVSMTPAEYAAGAADGYRVIDVSPVPTIRGAAFVDLTSVNGELPGIGREEKLLLVCARGKRGYFLQNRLRQYGYRNTVVLEGASFFNEVKVKDAQAAVSPEEKTRVKALGFLFDKRSQDRFNARVITRNGKITAEESKAIAQAAERFGSGELAMTSRLTVEIQGVPFDNIEPLREFLAQAGLETGGTGSKVRPIVSCKGTTCQFGLIDTLRPLGGNPRAVLSRLPRGQAPAQVQNRRRRLSEQLRQARFERRGHHRPARAAHRRRPMPRLQGMSG